MKSWNWMHTAIVICGGLASEAPKIEALLPPTAAQCVAIAAQLAASACVVFGVLSSSAAGETKGQEVPK